MKYPIVFAGIVGLAAATVVWAADMKDAPVAPVPAGAVAPAAEAAAKPAGPAVPIDLNPIHNGLKMGRKIISGSCPYGDAGFKALAAQGVKTILTVDGAMPDLKTAKKYGMRYVHIPINYGGMTRDQELQIARAVRDLQGPIFIHCHHGMHRSPSAAVIAAMVNEAWTNEDAVAALGQAGTGKQYTGLWADARDFKVPTKEELDKADNTFPETQPIEALAATMVTIDERWDHMGQVQKAGWKAPADHPDIDPPHEALLLNEAFRELARLPETAKHPADYTKKMNEAATATAALEAAIRAGDTAEAGDAYKLVAASCKSCHAVYRDPDQLKAG